MIDRKMDEDLSSLERKKNIAIFSIQNSGKKL